VTETAVAKLQDQAPASIETGNVLSILNRVISDPNLPMERVNQAFDFYERVERRNAKIAFDHALAKARAEIKPIVKTRPVSFGEGKNATNYKHETLADIANAIDGILAAHGISYRFRTQSGPNMPISVTCILAHEMGHFEENTLVAPPDSSGSKNPIQQIGSTVVYLQRYTLKASVGLAAAHDDDGNGGEKPRKSSSAAKKDGTTEKFNAIKFDFESATSVDHLMALKEQHWPEVETLPARWYELLEETYALMFDDLASAEKARAS
jgi:hypothetical protein